MLGDCHIHMILDGVYYRAAIDHQKDHPDEALIRQRLADYASRGITFLRDGGDAWGVGLLASRLAEAYGIRCGEIRQDSEIEEKLEEMLHCDGPYIMVCHVDPDAKTSD